MFCSQCGNQLKDSDRFCAKCGAAVLKQFEPQENPAAEPVCSQAPVTGRAEAQPVNYQAVAPVQKKSKKGLIIGLSLGGVLLAVILAAGLIFVFGLKGGSKGNDGSINLGYSTVVYDDQYTYFLSETETWAPCIKRVSNDLSGQPEILYETEKIEGDGWSKYPLGALFLWNDKICFLEFTNATEQGDEEYEIHWLSKDGKENGTLVSYEDFIGYARSLYRDDFQPLMEEVYFFGDYLIFSDRYSFCQLNLNTGGMFEYDTLLSIQGPACFVAYNDGYYYYFVPDTENNRMGETLYRMYRDIEEGVLGEAEEIGKVPLRDDEDVLDFWEKYYPFIPKGDYLYYADSENIYRLSINDGEIEKLTSYDDSTYNRFALCENGLYYYKDMTLHFLNTETLEETIFDEVEGIPNLIYAGADDACWMQDDATSHRYNCFRPDKQGESFIYFGESDQDASIDHQETVNTAELYADVIDRTIAEHGALWFDEVEYSSVQFYVCDRVTDYGAQKNLMKGALQANMEDILKRLELAVPENSSTHTDQSEFDVTSMLGEWALEIAEPNTENVSRYVIRLWPDGIMDLQAEDGSWLNYTYTMDQTHFYFTYEASGITSGGTYIVSEGKIILSIER